MCNTFELGILGCLLAERRARCDTVDIQRISRVGSVRLRIGNERSLVRHALALREIDHRVGVLLLCARVRVGEEGVDAVDTRELYAGVVRDCVASGSEAELLPGLGDRWKVGLRDAFGDGTGGDGPLELEVALGFGGAGWRGGGGAAGYAQVSTVDKDA